MNAAVVGVLLAALIRPVCSSSIHSGFDAAVALLALLLLVRWKVAPWMIVIGAASISALSSIWFA